MKEQRSGGGTPNKCTEADILIATQTLKQYKAGKAALDERVIANREWYRVRHWDYIKQSQGCATAIGADGKEHPVRRHETQPTSAWLFNAIANKHADMMDNFPSPVILAREKGDEQAAKMLSAILPVTLERNAYEETYSDLCWDKLISGVGIYGVFWDATLENGLGDIKVTGVDALNVFWEPGISDLQKSRNLFICAAVDEDLLRERYRKELGEETLATGALDMAEYVHDDYVDKTEKVIVVDWYYKRWNGTKQVLHYCKFAGSKLLYSSENDPMMQDGWYAHGQYPLVVDSLYPIKDSVAGFGIVDILRSPQMYIDKLNQVLLENAFLAGRGRYLMRESAGINEDELTDFSVDVIHATGSTDSDSFRKIEVTPLPGMFHNLLEHKINELKETSGSRDFNQGGTMSGVTAASAIAALQEAGNKGSRDIIKGSYRAYRNVVTLCIELIRQYYDEERAYRITGENGNAAYTQFSNAGIKEQPIQARETSGMQGADLAFHRPVFDVVVKAEKTSPFSRASQNELAKELYQLGFFNPQMADQSLGALDLMDFDGKDKVVSRVSEGKTLLSVVEQMRGEMDKMAAVIASMTGRSLSKGEKIPDMGGAGAGMEPPMAQAAPTEQEQGNQESQKGGIRDDRG